MAKEVKVGVHLGSGAPPFVWNVVLLEMAIAEAHKFLDEGQYHHAAGLVMELARESDPSHSVTQDVDAVEDFFELRDKGGPLGNINLRVFFFIDKRQSQRAIVVLGAIGKQNNGATPYGDKQRMKRRKRLYLRGQMGAAAINDRRESGQTGREGETGL
jgi:hypothetical protein